MSSQDFDRQFRRSARSMRRRPSPRSWDRIEARLDGRGKTTRFLGIRPWLIAAVLLLVAGTVLLITLPDTNPGPLAQRAEFMEELDAQPAETLSRINEYVPRPDGRQEDYLVAPGERGRLMASPKYRL